MIGILHILWFLVCLAVKIDDTVLDLQCLSWQTHTALHIILTTVGRTGDDLTILCLILQDGLTTSLIDGIKVFQAHICRQGVWVRPIRIELIANAIAHLIIVECLILRRSTERITSGEIKDHDVIQFHLSEPLYTAIVPMGPLNIALTLHHGEGVLGQRHRQRSLWDTGAIAYFRYEEIVTRQQRLLQRTRWNDVILEEELVDEVDSHKCEHQGIHPRHNELHRFLGLLPPLPLDLLRNVNIKNKRYYQQSPPALDPIEEEQIEHQYSNELGPLHFGIEFFLFLHSF